MSVPAVGDHRGRRKAVVGLVADVVGRSPLADVSATIRLLTGLTDALEVDVERLGREIPSDQCGNPLPSGEAERRLWSNAQHLLEELQATRELLIVAEATARLAGHEVLA